MESIFELLSSSQTVAHSIFVIAIVAFLGLILGKIKYRGIGLGIGGVMFAGIGLSAIGITIDHSLLEFLRDFGLVIFVYMIGLQVGPSFIGTLKSQGLSLCLLSLLVVASGSITAAVFVLLDIVPLSAAAGILSGATTNTPSLGAASEVLIALPGSLKVVDPTLGYAISYPFGILGTILVVTFARYAFGMSAQEAEVKLVEEQDNRVQRPSTINLVVENENLIGLSIDEIPAVKDMGIVISRFLRDDEVFVPTGDLKLRLGDVFSAVGEDRSLKALTLIVGRVSDVDLKELPSELTVKHLLVTSRRVAGKTFAEIKSSEHFEVAITRVRRGDVEFVATEDVVLNFGDSVRVVGEEIAVKRLAARLGDSQQELQHFQFFPIFAGIVLGVILGNMKWKIPFLIAPLKLGLAGGPLLASMLMSNFINHRKFTTYVPYGANLALRELGIVLFLSTVGLKAGEQFFSVLFSAQGLVWLGVGALVTALPLVLVMVVCSRRSVKMNYLTFMGLCAGSMTDPPALAFATSLTKKSNAPAIAYATVYPFVMMMRILFAQVFVVLLSLSFA